MAPLLSRLLVSRISPRRIMLPISSYVLLLLYLLFFLLLLLLRFLSQARPLTSALPALPRLLILARRDACPSTRPNYFGIRFSLCSFPTQFVEASAPPRRVFALRVFRDPSLPREREERSPSRKGVSTRAASTYTSIYEVMKRIRSESRILFFAVGFAPLNFPRLGCALIRDSSADHSRYPFTFAIYSVLLLFPLSFFLSFSFSAFRIYLSFSFSSRRLPKRNELIRTSRFRRVSFTVLQVLRAFRLRFVGVLRFPVARARSRRLPTANCVRARSNFCNCHFPLSSTRDDTEKFTSGE